MKKRFSHVAVLKGGISKEREVSLRSGAAVANGLRETGYIVDEIDVNGPDFIVPAGVEAVFIALHGNFGEDGQIQRILEQKHIPYTGADPQASWLAFAKNLAKDIMMRHKIATPAYEILRPGQKRTLPLPVIVKPTRQGSSFGVHMVLDENDWITALTEAMTYNNETLVEEYIAGRELTVGIVGNEVLPVIEIRAPEGNYDFHAKYTKGITEYLVPAPLTKEQTGLCQRLARETYCALQCRGLGRVDLRLSPQGRMYVLELNTIPGFTETSLLPKAAKAAGYGFSNLCERIMEMAMI
jgi:D-alanine-D-alanine ligase